ncbi:hypothetical protein PGT21_016307 [Puccinia graminis f. sp. tritici]|uniref:Uncharacterized protein n=1 Tax=Puccinia graminis f. sp. tritici TaxID=56615 RepID=A0A5B0P4D7_PUCGR|nr:hypothetical protein PGT21_016307 [Puccinia graminis f. sp. tritici]
MYNKREHRNGFHKKKKKKKKNFQLSIIDHQTPSGLRSAAYHYIPSQSTVLRIPCSSRTNYQDSAKRQCGT